MPKVTVDFTNVGEGFTLVPEGEYICLVTKIEVKDGDKGKYLKWELTIAAGEHKGTKIYHNTSFAANALFNLRNTIMALGFEVPKAAFQVNTDLYIKKVVGVTVAHRQYEKDGKKGVAMDAAELWRAAKGERGWGRAVPAQNAAAAAKTASKPKDDDDDGMDMQAAADEGIDEIELD